MVSICPCLWAAALHVIPYVLTAGVAPTHLMPCSFQFSATQRILLNLIYTSGPQVLSQQGVLPRNQNSRECSYKALTHHPFHSDRSFPSFSGNAAQPLPLFPVPTHKSDLIISSAYHVVLFLFHMYILNKASSQTCSFSHLLVSSKYKLTVKCSPLNSKSTPTDMQIKGLSSEEVQKSFNYTTHSLF